MSLNVAYTDLNLISQNFVTVRILSMWLQYMELYESVKYLANPKWLCWPHAYSFDTQLLKLLSVQTF